jgi:hypothetical protein
MVTVRFLVSRNSWRFLLFVFFEVNLLWLMGFRSFRVLILTFQAALRGSSFNRTIGS